MQTIQLERQTMKETKIKKITVASCCNCDVAKQKTTFPWLRRMPLRFNVICSQVN